MPTLKPHSWAAALLALLLASSATAATASKPAAAPAPAPAAVAKAEPAAAAAEEATPAEDLPTNEDCLGCHDDETLTETLPDGKEISVYTDPKKFDASVHGSLACVDCHSTLEEVPHDDVLPKVDCASCHEDEAKDYATSIHGMSQSMGASAAACCGLPRQHDILAVDDRPSRRSSRSTSPRPARAATRRRASPRNTRCGYPEAADALLGEHPRARAAQDGLIVAPSCNDCHGVHDIRRAVDRSSPINHANIAKTCGKCHVGIEEIYAKSIHGQLLAKGDPRGPVCTDCHSAHEIELARPRTATSSRERRALRRLPRGPPRPLPRDLPRQGDGAGPAQRRRRGRRLLTTATATTTSCPSTIPPRGLSPAGILGTCQQCHPGATAGFTQYLPHANPLDSENYPMLNKVFVFMTALLVGVFGFFGLHTPSGCSAPIYLFLTDSKTFREAKVKAQSTTSGSRASAVRALPPLHRGHRASCCW
jgi:hypothetical protein